MKAAKKSANLTSQRITCVFLVNSAKTEDPMAKNVDRPKSEKVIFNLERILFAATSIQITAIPPKKTL